jgi:hypothetical protein
VRADVLSIWALIPITRAAASNKRPARAAAVDRRVDLDRVRDRETRT